MRRGGRLGLVGAASVSLCLAAVGLGGCTAAVGKALDAPLQVIPRTDVVVETNVQSAFEAAQANLAVSGSFAGFGPGSGGGTDLTAGPSTAPGQISFAVTPGGTGIVFAGWNHADQHCVGSIYVSAQLSSPVLGVSTAGRYDFIAPSRSSVYCDAATFVGSPATPLNWPELPSVSGWPPA
ncbi:MAG: hypothetical protein ACYDGN_14880 [Acidimicrobiales bacterium]